MKPKNKTLRNVLGFGLRFGKPTRRSTVKAREDRAEARVIKEVRAACAARDGYCRLAWLLLIHPLCPLEPCSGPSEWAHMEGHRRFETVNRPPDERHSTVWTVMLCKRHHVAYDERQIDLERMTASGADGAMHLRIGDNSYEEIR